MNIHLTGWRIALLSAAVSVPSAVSQEPTSETQDSAAEDTAMTFRQPAVVTTVGRADGTIVRVLCQRANLDATLIEDVTPEDLQGVGTLVIAMGGSVKGLGAAGIDVEEEMARGESVLAAAASAELPVLGVHVGGEARRGELSDGFCELVVQGADALIVKATGNADGFFTRAAKARGIPIVEVETNGAAIEAIGKLFGADEE